MKTLPVGSAFSRAALDVAPRIHALLDPLVPQEHRTTEPCQLGYYEWYFALGQVLKPESYLEIGVLGGASAVSVALGAGAALAHVTLMDNESHGEGKQAVPLAVAAERVMQASAAPRPDRGWQWAQVTHLADDSQRLSALPVWADLIHIDGDHRVGPCYHDLRISLSRLARGGHLIVDDANWPWVKDATAAFLDDHPEIAGFYVPTTSGMFVLHGCHEGACLLLVEAAG